MTNIKKSINLLGKSVFAISIAGFLIFPSISLASGPTVLNTDPQDELALQVSNRTTCVGCNNWSNSVSANAGDIVSFMFFYHNTGANTANNLSVRIQLSNSGNNIVANGTISATNAPSVSGSATVVLPAGITLPTSPISVLWYRDQNNSTGIDQNIGTIMNSGLTLGDIQSGWSHQGWVVVRFQLNSAPGGGSGVAPTVYTSSVSNATQNSATLNGSVNPNNASTNYWFEYGATQSLGTVTPTQTISGNSSQSVNSTINNLSANTTYYYRLVGQNSAGTTQGSILSFTTQSTGGGGQGTAPLVYTSSVFNATQNSATLNGSVNPNNASTNYWFEYGTTQNLGYQTATQYLSAGSYSQTVSLPVYNLNSNTSYYYRVVAQNSYGTSQGSILNFYTSNQGGGGNGQAPYATTNYATNVSNGSATLRGSVNPNNSYTSAWFEYGTTQSFGNTTPTQGVSSGNYSIDYSYTISGLLANTTYYFRAVANNSYGTVYGATQNFVADNSGGGGYSNLPFVSTLATSLISGNVITLNGSVNPNGNGVYTWFEYGVSFSSLNFSTPNIYTGSGNFNLNFNQTVSNLISGSTYYYRAAANRGSGTPIVYGQILSFTVSGINISTQAPIVATKSATFVMQNSATLNADVNPNGSSATAWFEYGINFALGTKTTSLAFGSVSGTLGRAESLFGLSLNTSYYYRVVAQNSFGVTYGLVNTFKTLSDGTIVIPPPITIVPSIITANKTACISLAAELDDKDVIPGKEFIYTATYKNDCDYAITNVSLKVVLPKEVSFISTDSPLFRGNSNDIIANIGRVDAGATNSVIIKGIVNEGAKKESNLIYSGIISFNDNFLRPQSVSYYLTATVKGGNNFTANLMDAMGALVNPVVGGIAGIGLLILGLWQIKKKFRIVKRDL